VQQPYIGIDFMPKEFAANRERNLLLRSAASFEAIINEVL